MASAATSKQPIFASNLPTAHVVGNFLRDIIFQAFGKKFLPPASDVPCARLNSTKFIQFQIRLIVRCRESWKV